jgi:hypothetical protein
MRGLASDGRTWSEANGHSRASVSIVQLDDR